MADIFGSLKDALLSVFNSYHTFIHEDAEPAAEFDITSGFTGISIHTRPKDEQHCLDVRLGNISILPSDVGNHAHYYLVSAMKLEAIEAYVDLHQYISEWDQSYQLAARSWRLYKEVERLLKGTSRDHPLRKQLKELWSHLSPIGRTHRIEGDLRQGLEEVELESLRRQEICGQLIVSHEVTEEEMAQSSKRFSQEILLIFNYFTDTHLDDLEVQLTQIKQASLGPSTFQSGALAQSTANGRRRRLEALKKEQLDRDRYEFHAEGRYGAISEDLKTRYELITQEIIELSSLLEDRDPEADASEDEAKQLHRNTEASDRRVDPRVFLGRRGST